MNKKDIQAIGEVYINSISTINENFRPQRSFEDLKRVYGESLYTTDLELYRTEQDDNTTTVIFAFAYDAGSEGDYTTPKTYPSLKFLQTFDHATLEPVDLNDFYLEDTPQEEIRKAENKLMGEIETSSEEEESSFVFHNPFIENIVDEILKNDEPAAAAEKIKEDVLSEWGGDLNSLKNHIRKVANKKGINIDDVTDLDEIFNIVYNKHPENNWEHKKLYGDY